jgi:hypothetical protein
MNDSDLPVPEADVPAPEADLAAVESNVPPSEPVLPAPEPAALEPVSSPPSAPYNLQDNLVYMFKDKDWVSKIIVGALIGLVPILNFATAGYAVQTTRNIRDDQQPLPGWSSNLGKFFMEGLKLFVIGILYSIPLWILSLITIPLFSSDSGAAVAVGVLIGLVELVFALLLIFWFQGVIVNFANKGTIGSGFAFGAIWGIIQKNMGRMLVTVGVAILASIIVGVVAGILGIIPCIGWIASWLISFAAAFYILLVFAYNCGHIAKSS